MTEVNNVGDNLDTLNKDTHLTEKYNILTEATDKYSERSEYIVEN